MLAYAYGGPLGQAVLKSCPQDFCVVENLGFTPEGQGEHVFLSIRKSSLNTQDVIQRLAKLSGVSQRDIGYSGLKDRHAVCTQWFSVYLAAKPEPDWTQLEDEEIQLLEVTRHQRKLRIGVHRSNYFELLLRETSLDAGLLSDKIQRLQQGGFANYFGPQRFGRGGGNIVRARALFQRTAGKEFKPKRKDSMFLSAARSQLFNELLSARVKQENWNAAIAGEVFQFIDGRALFQEDDLGAAQQRLSDGEIVLTGPLWGVGESLAKRDVALLEQSLVEQEPELLDGLSRAGLRKDRRALCAKADELNVDLDGSLLKITFTLQRGVYATTLLREIVQTSFD